jgi:hypothetical protein
MAVTLVFLGKLADLAGAPEQRSSRPARLAGLLDALPGPLRAQWRATRSSWRSSGPILADKAALLAERRRRGRAAARPSAEADVRDIRLLSEPFNPGAFIGPFTNANPGLGGVASFVGEGAPGRGRRGARAVALRAADAAGMHALADAAFARFELMGLLMAPPGRPDAPRRADRLRLRPLRGTGATRSRRSTSRWTT